MPVGAGPAAGGACAGCACAEPIDKIPSARAQIFLMVLSLVLGRDGRCGASHETGGHLTAEQHGRRRRQAPRRRRCTTTERSTTPR